MKTLSILLTLLGLLLLTGFMVWLGAPAVIRAVLSVGFGGFALLVLWQVLSDGLLAIAWRAACPRAGLDVGIGQLLFARMMREAAMTCLPFSQLGGILIGMRATCIGRRPPSWPAAAAANVIDLTVEIIGQVGFVLMGLMFLLDRRPDNAFVGPVGLGMMLGVVAVTSFIWAQRRAGGLFQRGAGLLSRRLVPWMQGLENWQEAIDGFYARPGRIALGVVVHLLGWLASAGWVWLVYRLLGARLEFGAALAIEGVASGVLSVSFLVPAALGVQEAAYVAIGALFGLDPHLSFGLSLLRRGRDLAIGGPMLLIWQWLEMLRLRRLGADKGSALDPLGS